MHIVGGNQRYEALKQLGVKEVEVSYVEIEDENKEKALNIRLNNSSGEWNEIKLQNILEELKVENIDISLTGFEDIKIETYDEINFNNSFGNDNYDDIEEYSSNNSFDYDNSFDDDVDFSDIDDLYEDEDTKQLKDDAGWDLNYTIRFNNPIDEDMLYKFIENIKNKYKKANITENIIEDLNQNLEKNTSNMPFKSDFELIFKDESEKNQFVRFNEILKNRYPKSKYPLIDYIKEFENGL